MLMYHIVSVVKYRKEAITKEVKKTINETCIEISQRYEIHFVEIGVDGDHVHYLVQSVPMMSPKRLVQLIKSITAREVFKNNAEVKKLLWGGKFWTSGYYINTVGKYSTREVIQNYVRNQGKNYEQLLVNQPTLFDITN